MRCCYWLVPLFLLGCGPKEVVFVSQSPAPRTMAPTNASEIPVLTEHAPRSPHVVVGVLQHSNFETLLNDAATRGCEALMASISVEKSNLGLVQRFDGHCVVFEDPAAAAQEEKQPCPIIIRTPEGSESNIVHKWNKNCAPAS
jgi:hypothetical protein